MAETSRTIGELNERIERSIQLDREKQLFDVVKERRGRYVSSRKRSEELDAQGKRDESARVISSEVMPDLTVYRKAWQAFNDFEDGLMEASVRDSAALYGTARMTRFADQPRDGAGRSGDAAERVGSGRAGGDRRGGLGAGDADRPRPAVQALLAGVCERAA
jgi:hypothetical protein